MSQKKMDLLQQSKEKGESYCLEEVLLQHRKSALVEKIAEDLRLPCVSLLVSQLAPEDIMGVPQITDKN